MLLTEDEAKTKECRVGDPVTVTRTDEAIVTTERALCCASGCMHWRWGEPEWFRQKPERGYCGLAGKP